MDCGDGILLVHKIFVKKGAVLIDLTIAQMKHSRNAQDKPAAAKLVSVDHRTVAEETCAGSVFFLVI